MHTGAYLQNTGMCLLSDSTNMFGFIAAILFSILSILSLNVIRRRYYELFRASHWLFIPAYILTVMHAGTMALYGALPLALYVYDRYRRHVRRYASMYVLLLVRFFLPGLCILPLSTSPSVTPVLSCDPTDTRFILPRMLSNCSGS